MAGAIRYTYSISTTGLTGERFPVSPVHDKDIALVMQKEDGQEFYRKKFEGKISLLNDEYFLLYDAGINTVFTLFIAETLRGEPVDVYVAEFRYTDCTFDEDNHIVTVDRMDTVDEYKKILDNYDKEFDIIELGVKSKPCSYDKTPALQIYVPSASSVTTFATSMGAFDSDASVESDFARLMDGMRFMISAVRAKGYIYRMRDGLVPDGLKVDASGTFKVNPWGESGGIYPVNPREDPEQARWYRANGLFMKTSATPEPTPIMDVTFDFNVFDRCPRDYLTVNTNAPKVDVTYHIFGGEGDSYIDKIDSGGTGQPYLAWGKYDGYAVVNPDADPEDRVYWGWHMGLELIYTRMIVPYHVNVGNYFRTYPVPSDDVFGVNKNFPYASACVFGDWLYASESKTLEETKWGNYDKDYYYAAPFESPDLYPVAQPGWNETSYWFYMRSKDGYLSLMRELADKQTIKDTYPVHAIISKILEKIGAPGYDAATGSDFFHGDTRSLDPVGYELRVTPMSNVLAGNYTVATKKAKTTLKRMFDLIAGMYDAHWYVEDGAVRVEHMRFFKRGLTYSGEEQAGLDLTHLLVERNNRAWSVDTSVYSYDTSKSAKDLKFGYSDEASDLFVLDNVHVDSKYIPDSAATETTELSGYNPDLMRMIFQNPDARNDSYAVLAVHERRVMDVPDGTVLELTEGVYTDPVRISGVSSTLSIDIELTYGLSLISDDYKVRAYGTFNGAEYPIGWTPHYDRTDTSVMGQAGSATVSGRISVTGGVTFESIRFRAVGTSHSSGRRPVVGRLVLRGMSVSGEGLAESSAGSLGIEQVDGMPVVNGELSFRRLFQKYLTYDMPGADYHIGDADDADAVPEVAKGLNRSKVQSVSAPVRGRMQSPYQRVRTKLGLGQIITYSMNLETGMANISLRYDQEDLEEAALRGGLGESYDLADSDGYLLVDSEGYTLTVRG